MESTAFGVSHEWASGGGEDHHTRSGSILTAAFMYDQCIRTSFPRVHTV